MIVSVKDAIDFTFHEYVVDRAARPVGSLIDKDILAGIILFVFRNTIAQFLARFDEGFQIRLSPLADELMRDPARFAGGDELTLLAVYVGVFALIMLTGSWMVLRFVRS